MNKNKQKKHYFKKRTLSRQLAVQMMYSAEITEDAPEDIIKSFEQNFSENEDDIFEFANKLFRGSYKEIKQNDQLISDLLAEGWTIDRIGIVEKCLLRVAIYELFAGDTPSYAVIDEYTTLAKSFGDNKSASFINGIIGNIRLKFSIELGYDKRI